MAKFLLIIQKKKVKKWRQEIRAQQRGIDRQIRAIDTEEAKVKKSIKQVAKKGDVKNCKMLAKELIRSQRHKNRLYTSKAQMNSIIMQLELQMGKFKYMSVCFSWVLTRMVLFSNYQGCRIASKEWRSHETR